MFGGGISVTFMIETDKEFDYEKYKGENLLEWFAIWYIKRAKKERCLPMRTVQDNCLYTSPSSHVSDNSTSGITLYRQKNLQVQLFILPPNSSVSSHTHPNMDSYEAYVGGDLFLTIDGQQAGDHDKLKDFDNLKDKESFYADAFLKYFRVKPTTPHGGTTGGKGGAFLSIQHWKNDVEPSSPTKDWRDS